MLGLPPQDTLPEPPPLPKSGEFVREGRRNMIFEHILVPKMRFVSFVVQIIFYYKLWWPQDAAKKKLAKSDGGFAFFFEIERFVRSFFELFRTATRETLGFGAETGFTTKGRAVGGQRFVETKRSVFKKMAKR